MAFYETLNFGFSKTCFRTDPLGRTSYHPWVHTGGGYLIEDDAHERYLRRHIGYLNVGSLFIFLPILFLLSLIVGPEICLFAFFLAMFGAWQYMRFLARRMKLVDAG